MAAGSARRACWVKAPPSISISLWRRPETVEAAVGRLLLVDDEENILALFKRILEKEGYEVECACSGDQALAKLETTWFDLVITDLKMPGMDGLELLKR